MRVGCLPELKVHEAVSRVSQLLKAKEGQVKVVHIPTARWVGACHCGAAAIILQTRAAVSDMNVDGVVGIEQPHGLHHNTFNDVRTVFAQCNTGVAVILYSIALPCHSTIIKQAQQSL